MNRGGRAQKSRPPGEGNVIKLRNHNIPPPQDPSRRPCLSFSSAAKNLGRGLLEDDGGGGPIP